MTVAPLPLAFERSIEAKILSGLEWKRPILDIGCGEGLFAQMVFADKIDTGVDPNAKELVRARELGGYNELIECYGNAIPKPDGSYQTIFANSVLEHIPDLKPVLREAHRLLAPGGRLYFTVPSDKFDHYTVINKILAGFGLSGLAARYRKFFNGFWRHYHYYSLAEWESLVQRCGFEVVESRTYDPAKVCITNDALVPVSLPGFVIKRLTNRWTLFPSLRGVLLYPVYAWAKGLLEGAERAEAGGLVFLSLTKSGAA